jgi:pimeloyl-ACP methyl ester carboxylesterase
MLTRRGLATSGLAFAGAAWATRSPATEIVSLQQEVNIGEGVRLHVADVGTGEPVVFVHGSLSDYTYWSDQQPAFAAAGRRSIAYSRRYNWPNRNKPIPSYSAVTDAQDLAGLIGALELGRVHLVGHSYGALTSLILAARRPDLVRTVSLAEPPAMSLLAHAPDAEAARGKAMLADVRRRMIPPMTAAFRRGDREAGVAHFIDYVFQDPQAWARLPAAAKAETLKDAGEWDVMLTTGELFPEVTPAEVRRIQAPVLLLSGGKSYPFLGVIDETLASLLPQARRILFPEATHQMWLQQPEACRQATLDVQARG